MLFVRLDKLVIWLLFKLNIFILVLVKLVSGEIFDILFFFIDIFFKLGNLLGSFLKRDKLEILLFVKFIYLSVGVFSLVRGEIFEILLLLIFNWYNCGYLFGVFKKGDKFLYWLLNCNCIL